MGKGLLDILFDNIFDVAAWKGSWGETLTEMELNWVQLLGRKGKILRNVYLPKTGGETSELDVIFITQKGIFIFESKNYSGWIFGDENNQYWTAMLPNKEKHRFYNPVKQNRNHLKWMRNFVGNDVPLFSVIVFSERCELKNVSVKSPDVSVIKRDRIYATVRSIWEANPDVLNTEQVDILYEKLKPLTGVDEAIKATHVDNLKQKYAESVTIPGAQAKQKQQNQTRTSEPSLICPRCGKPLILRTARKGSNVGTQFYGCSGFPACRYIRKIDSQR